jgi:hypothetical protein
VFGSVTVVRSPVAVRNVYTAVPMPSTFKPDTMPCNVVGCTGRGVDIKSDIS